MDDFVAVIALVEEAAVHLRVHVDALARGNTVAEVEALGLRKAQRPRVWIVESLQRAVAVAIFSNLDVYFYLCANSIRIQIWPAQTSFEHQKLYEAKCESANSALSIPIVARGR